MKKNSNNVTSSNLIRSSILTLTILIASITNIHTVHASHGTAGPGICSTDNTVACSVDADCAAHSGGTCFLPTSGGDVLSSADVTAQTGLTNTCMEDLYNTFGQGGGLGCTANDVNLATTSNLVVIDGCDFPGDTATISFVAKFDLTAQERHDVGVYIAEDGGNALTGSCSISNFPEAPDAPWLDLDTTCNGGGCPQPTDTCGDIDDDHNPLFSSIENITVSCVDDDANGDLDISTCLSWRQPGANDLCTAPFDAFPGAPSKCRCQSLPGITIEVPGRISAVDKVTLDANGNPLPGDPTLFNFALTGPDPELPVSFMLADADAPYQSPGLDPGNGYNLVETTTPGWTLVSADCTSDQGGSIDLIATGGDFSLNNGESLSCTFTNQFVPTNPALSITKEATEQSFSALGDLVEYTIIAINTGDTTLDSVTVTDPLVDNLVCTPVNGSSLEPTENMLCTASHTITQADIDAGSFLNTACVDDGAGGADQACENEEVLHEHLLITKMANPMTYSAIGDVIDYTIVASNDGMTTLNNVIVTDPLVDNLECIPDQGATLAPGESMICTATHTIDQTDLDNGSFLNTACVDDGIGGADQACDDEQILLDLLSITKVATQQSYSMVGDVIDYTIVATNDGMSTLTDVTVTDPLVDNLACTPNQGATLAPGESMNCTASHTIDQDDLDNGSFLNTACVDDDPAGGADEACADEEVTTDPNPSLDITKVADQSTFSAVGDEITYTITAINNGNLTLENVIIEDQGVAIPTLDCEPTNGSTLPPGSELMCFVTYTITQDDVDNGSYLNTACVDDDPNGGADEACADEEILLDQLSITKVATQQNYSAVGDVIDYTIVATNDGMTTLTNVIVTDPLVDNLVCTPDQGATLAPGESMNCTASHTIDQDDLDNGSFLNTACVDDDPAGGADEACADEEVTTDPNPSLTITKVATQQSYSMVGDVIDYTIVATNNGNLTLTDVNVTDALVDNLVCTPDQGATLAPGESMNCTASHTIDQDDLDNGSFLNTACVDDDPAGGADEACADEEVTTDPNPSLTITKVATQQSYSMVGDVIDYTIVATNNGNLTLTDVNVTDALVDNLVCTPDQGATLAPGESMNCTASHSIDQDDLDNGSFLNTACVDDDPAGGADEACADEEVTTDPNPSLTITKVATQQNYSAVGDVIDYTIVATNNGNLTLMDVNVTDALVDNLVCTPDQGATLAPGESMNCTASHTIDQDDLDNGSFLNTACVDDDPAGGADEACADEEVTTDPNPSLTITKVATQQSYSMVGDVIDYTIVATNNGNLTLTDVNVTDALVDNLVCTPDQGATLAPGESMNCTASHTIDQDDLDNGSFLNTACVDDDPAGGADEACADEEVTTDPNPSLTITKVATQQSYSMVGDVIDYTIVATNNGNLTLTDVNVTDALVDNLACTPDQGATLAPGESMNCTASHTIDQDDLDNGSFLNTACVDDDPAGGADEACADEEVTTDPNPSLTITKVATQQNYSAVGDVIDYTIVATNNGNLTLTDVNVTDALVDNLVCTPDQGATLAPGESMNCTASHTIDQDDLDNGSFLNTACVDDDPAGGADEACADEEVTTDPNPSLTITKVATQQNYSAVGDVIDYTIVATNNGNLTLTDVNVTDALVDNLVCTPDQGATLAPGESMNCTASHSIDQDDLDNGSFLNTACVDDDPAGGADEACADEEVPAAPIPDLEIDKELTINEDQDGSGTITRNDVLRYTITATNTGNTTETITIIDDLTGDGMTCTDVPPNGTCVLEVTFTVGSPFLDAGVIENTALACIEDVDPEVCVSDTVTVDIDDPNPGGGGNACGQPNYSPANDREIFLWQDCAGDDTWYIRAAAGGGDFLNYSGNLTTDQTFTNIVEFSFEGVDEVTNTGSVMDFLMRMGNNGQDGINFNVDSGNTCLTLDQPTGIDVLVGANRTAVTPPFDIETLGACGSDGLPTLSINDVQLSEGAGMATLNVTLSSASATDVTVNYNTANGSAVVIADYTGVSGLLTFTPGVTSLPVSVPIIQDLEAEGSETFSVLLNTPSSNATISDATGVVTILDDDPPIGGDACGQPNYDRTLDRAVFLWQDCAGDDSWHIRVSGGIGPVLIVSGNLMTDQVFSNISEFSYESNDILTSSANQIGFTMRAGRNGQDGINFSVNPGSTCLTIDQPAGSDVLVGANRTPVASAFDIETLGACGGGGLPNLNISDTQVSEAAGSATLSVTLSPSSTDPVTVNYTMTDVSATDGEDYTADSGTLTFNPGITSQSITIPISQDMEVEGNETFNVVLDTATNASISDGTGVVAILDDDSFGNDACGQPSYTPANDREIFLWQDCAGDGTWYIRAAAGGGAFLTYSGNLVTDQTFTNVGTFSFEGADMVDTTTTPGQMDFLMRMGNNGQDGINFNVNPGNTCFTLDQPSGIDVLVGANRTPVSSPFNIETLGPCI